MQLEQYIDYTNLKPDATRADIEELCKIAKERGYANVCVNGAYVALCKQSLRGSGVGVACVVGFPLGASTTEVKAFEAAKAVEDGADEIDMVINIGMAKAGDWAGVQADIAAVVQAAGKAAVKVIIETCLLDEEEKISACLAAKAAGAAFVKTSTGFSTAGATVEDIRLMRETVGPDMGVKAAGGIRDTATALAMLEAGATRIGASATGAIVGA